MLRKGKQQGRRRERKKERKREKKKQKGIKRKQMLTVWEIGAQGFESTQPVPG